MGANISIANAYESVQQGDFPLVSTILHNQKEDFLVIMKKKLDINSFQAENLYKKARFSLVSSLINRKITLPEMSVTELLNKTGERIFSDNFTPGDDIKEESYLMHIKNEIIKLDTIPGETLEAQKKLDDKCKQLIILIYYAKFSLSKTLKLMGLENLEDLDTLLTECKSKVREYLT